MIGYAPPWLFAVLAVAALVGLMACTVRMVLRPVITGVACRHGAPDAEAVPAVLYLAVAVLATTLRALGA